MMKISCADPSLSTHRSPTPTALVEVAIAAPPIQPNSVGRLPGIVNLFFLPFDIIYTTSALIKAKSLGDTEAELDATLRLSTLPLNALSSISSTTSLLFQIGTLTSYLRATFSSVQPPVPLILSMNVIGVILCAIETIVEAIAVRRQCRFLSIFHLHSVEKIDQYFTETNPQKKKELLLQSCHHLCHNKAIDLPAPLIGKLKNLELTLLLSSSSSEQILKSAEEALQEASRLILQKDAECLSKKYLLLRASEKEKIDSIVKRRFASAPAEKIDQEIALSRQKMLEVKSNNLARRVEPWCAQELSSRLTPLVENMKSSDAALRDQATAEVKELLITTKIQAQKYLAYHIVSMCIFAVSAAVFIAVLCSCPPLIPLFLLGAIGAVYCTSYFLHSGSINQRRWKFSLSDCVPFHIKCIYQRAKNVWNGAIPKVKERLFTPVASSAQLKRSYQAI